MEEEFIEAYLKAGFIMLENPANIKISEIKDLLFQMMAKCIERFGGEVKRMQASNSNQII